MYFKLRVVYNDSCRTFLEELKKSGLEIESYHDVYDKKEAWALKGSFAARESPFVVFYYKDKLQKAFYSEDSSCALDKIFNYIKKFIKDNSKHGQITIEQIEGTQVGRKEYGYTNTFMEGCGLYLGTISHWYHTSIIKDIDWENKIFHTLNSTYKFDFHENTNNQSESEPAT